MALSNDEQRTLDEIERALRDDDPTFVTAVSFDHLRRHRAIVGGLAFLFGMVALVAGEVVSQTQFGGGRDHQPRRFRGDVRGHRVDVPWSRPHLT